MGARTRDHLTLGRGLSPETIRSARLGFTYPVSAIPGKPEGIVIPWFRGDASTLVKIRQPEGRKPKYREVFRNRARHCGVYPGLGAIRPGRPLIVTEGEFDCLLLAQELGDLAAVVTLGSASAMPDPGILTALLSATPWLIATDADYAGERAAAGWPASARRVRPPEPFKDWTEAKRGGVDLRRWWGGHPRRHRTTGALHLGGSGRLALGACRRRPCARPGDGPCRARRPGGSAGEDRGRGRRRPRRRGGTRSDPGRKRPVATCPSAK